MRSTTAVPLLRLQQRQRISRTGRPFIAGFRVREETYTSSQYRHNSSSSAPSSPSSSFVAASSYTPPVSSSSSSPSSSSNPPTATTLNTTTIPTTTKPTTEIPENEVQNQNERSNRFPDLTPLLPPGSRLSEIYKSDEKNGNNNNPFTWLNPGFGGWSAGPVLTQDMPPLTSRNQDPTLARSEAQIHTQTHAQRETESLTRIQTSSTSPHPLAGKTIAIKDNFMVRGVKATCSSRMLRDYEAPYNATVVERLFGTDFHVPGKSLATSTSTSTSASAEDGSSQCPILVGKTHMDEFGMGSSNSHLPSEWKTRIVNPLDRSRSPGGSSGGSASVVSSGLAWASLGTDTGGSVRLPASYCGIVGHKPSYGWISRFGVVSYADSLDTVGIMARKVQDVESVFGVISGEDERDATCVGKEVREKAGDIEGKVLEGWKDGLKGVRIGVPIETSSPNAITDAYLRPYLTHLQSLGATLIPVSIPHMLLSLPAYYVLATAEASSNLARYGGGWYGGHGKQGQTEMHEEPESAKEWSELATRRKQDGSRYSLRERTRTWGLGKEVKKRILAGTHALTKGAFDNSYLRALEVRERLKTDYARVFRVPRPNCGQETETPSNGIDILIHPTALGIAPVLDPPSSSSSSSSTIKEYAGDILTTPASMAGLPCLSVPVHRGGGVETIGISLTTQWGMDKLLFHVAKVGGS